jgi:NADPH:quinone reductase-like Zn-dependent oxidoreductase
VRRKPAASTCIFRPIIDRTYPLTEVGEAIRYLETGQVKGKVVVTI